MVLLAELAAALVLLGAPTRLQLEIHGGVALSVMFGGRIVTVVVVENARGGAGYLWGGVVRFPAGAGADVTREAAAALAGGVR
ncbi:hypothetical protein DMH08_37930 [Actinomadura sp. WAC 06369]|nr:hypothetical protein DMH08_37930 [Actinomadura sp. WAC 06369]